MRIRNQVNNIFNETKLPQFFKNKSLLVDDDESGLDPMMFTQEFKVDQGWTYPGHTLPVRDMIPFNNNKFMSGDVGGTLITWDTKTQQMEKMKLEIPSSKERGLLCICYAMTRQLIVGGCSYGTLIVKDMFRDNYRLIKKVTESDILSLCCLENFKQGKVMVI